jgi:cytochrome c oxidase subunit 1
MTTQAKAFPSFQKMAESGVLSWLFTVDHKKIGILYLVSAFVFFFAGGIEALLMRLQLSRPDNTFLSPDAYNQIFTMHGTTMIFLAVMPMAAGFGNYLVPLMIGARDMAFPKLNALSYWTFLVGGTFMYSSFVFGGAPNDGWFSYAPLTERAFSDTHGMDFWVLGILLLGLATTIGSINFIVTIIQLRAPGMSLRRMPVFVWTQLVTAFLAVFSLPSLTVAVLLLLLDRQLGAHFYNVAEGGSALLWQHLFWFFGHPEVYISILPGMGVTSHVLSNFSRKPVFGYRAMAATLCAIGFLGFLLWGHHMFVSGMNPYSSLAFSVLTLSVGVPSAVKTFNWLGTMWGGKLRFDTPMLFSIGFVSFFVTGGLSGIFLAQPALDDMLHATYYVVAHFHLVMAVAAIFGIFSATYYWFPKMFGRMMDETLGKVHFWLTFVGAYCIFMPMHFEGIYGGIRRYADSTGASYLAALHPLNLFMTIAAFVTAGAQLIFFYNFFRSLRSGAKATENPWRATTLEWATASPPPIDNFAGAYPHVYRGPYEYSVPGAAEDFTPQHVPPSELPGLSEGAQNA